MASVNRITILGNCVADPESRQTPKGSVTNIRVATSEQWTDKQSGQKQERSEYHRITLFNRLGEIAAQYLRKGSQVYIEGSIRTEKYQDKSTGQDRYSTSIIAREMQLLGGKSESRQQPAQAQTASQPSGGDFDDDIPFMPVHWLG